MRFTPTAKANSMTNAASFASRQLHYGGTVLSRLDQHTIPNSDEVRLFAKVRNEALRLPFFLSYYRSLGVDRFFIIDNGSTDDTLDILSQNRDCHIFSTSELMSKSRCGIDWIQPLLDQFGQSRWCVIVDADELLVYPDSETVPLQKFCEELDDSHANAFPCYLLDMYPEGPIDNIKYKPGQPFLDACPFFDESGYRWIHRRKKGPTVGPTIVGGPRLRMFNPELLDRRLRTRIKRKLLTCCGKIFPGVSPPRPITLNKIPLVRWNEKMSFEDAAHDISFANLASGVGALLHFKYLGNFVDKVREEMTRKAYCNDGEEYARYFRLLKNNHQLDFTCGLSRRFAGSRQLLELGLIKEIGGGSARRMHETHRGSSSRAAGRRIAI